MLKSYLAQVVAGKNLSRDQAREAMEGIMRGEASPEQIAGLLVGLRMKGETVDEIVGCAEAMRYAATRVSLGVDQLVDTAGTGGDGAGTFNISTAAALVAAGAGVPIAKHGNRAVSSSCGSADVLEALGVTLVAEPARLARCMASAGVVFLFAPLQHPAMKHAIGPRRELGLRSIFNLLGPLTNPAGARRQLLGVYDSSLMVPLARALGELGNERAMVVHGADGLDELSTTGPSEVAEWNGEEVARYRLDPTDLGLQRVEIEALRGGTPDHNAKLLRRVLAGEPGPARDVVAFNAAAAILVGGGVPNLAAGLDAAKQALDDGRAQAALDALIQASGEELAG